MNQKEIYDIFRNSKKHFIEVDGHGTWLSLCAPEIEDEMNITNFTEVSINKFSFCPFCGKSLYNNEVINEANPRDFNFTVAHFDNFYSGETIPDEWYEYGFDHFDDAMREYNGLKAAGFDDEQLYISDNRNSLVYSSGEWY